MMNHAPITNSQLKNFGLIWAGIFAIIAFFSLINGEEIRIWALSGSICFILISFLFPQLYTKTYFYQGWIKFGDFMGKINSKIIIFLLFFVVFLPMGIFLKIFRKDLLSKRIDKSAQTYFVNREKQPEGMENQF